MGSIYIIRNTINDKVYIGQTVQSLATRFLNHKPKYNTAYNYKWIFLDEYEKEVNKNGIK